MYALADGLMKPFFGFLERPQLRVFTTQNGFSISVVPRSGHDATYFAEAVYKVIGTMLIPAGGIVLVLPKVADGSAQLIIQALLLLGFVTAGVGLHRWADKGFRRKIEVDALRNEVRIGTVNCDNKFNVLEHHPVKTIESFFIVRSSNADVPSKLKMRLKAGSKTYVVAEGSERQLVPILERITMTLKPPQMKGRRVKTMTTGQFIRASFG